MSASTRRGSLRWAVKSSFVRYVETIAAGSREALDGAETSDDGVFEFPLLEASEGGEGRRLSFGGRVHFSAHHGFLDVDLRGLELSWAADSVELSIGTTQGGRVVIAAADPVVPVTGSGALRWTGLVPRLTEAGAEVFGNVYPPGSDLAPIDAVLLLD